jgi:hypothetical protein
MTGRAPLWLGLGLFAAGLVILGIGAVVERMRALHIEASGQPAELMAGRRRRCWVRVGSNRCPPAGRPTATSR